MIVHSGAFNFAINVTLVRMNCSASGFNSLFVNVLFQSILVDTVSAGVSMSDDLREAASKFLSVRSNRPLPHCSILITRRPKPRYPANA